MLESIYRQVWNHVFAATCVRLHDMEPKAAANKADEEAGWAAREAVLRYSSAMEEDALEAVRKGAAP